MARHCLRSSCLLLTMAMVYTMVVTAFFLPNMVEVAMKNDFWGLHGFVTTGCYSRKSPDPPISEIPRVSGMTPQVFYSEYVARGIPVIMTDIMKDWPATKKWSPQYFAELFPNYAIGQFNPLKGDTMETMKDYVDYLETFEDYIDVESEEFEKIASKGQVPYWSHDITFAHQKGKRNSNVTKIWEDVHQFPLLRQRPKFMGSFYGTDVPFFDNDVEAVFWMGPPGGKTHLHYDDDPVAILHQVMGSKEITLFPPNQAEYLYPSHCSFDEYGTVFSQVDTDNPDLTRFPLYSKAKSYKVELGQGEAIFLPNGWWHAVMSLETTISVSARIQTPCEQISFLPYRIAEWWVENRDDLPEWLESFLDYANVLQPLRSMSFEHFCFVPNDVFSAPGSSFSADSFSRELKKRYYRHKERKANRKSHVTQGEKPDDNGETEGRFDRALKMEGNAEFAKYMSKEDEESARRLIDGKGDDDDILSDWIEL